MKHRIKNNTIPAVFLLCLLLAGCASTKAPAQETAEPIDPPAETAAAVENAVEDGIYVCSFDTDSSMFHVNEACEGTARMTVKDGEMTIHLIMPSKNVLNLYPGLAAEAEEDPENILEPTTEEVTYSDGMTEEVFAFDVRVPLLDEEFDLALIGKKAVWYDHKVVVSVLEPFEEAVLPDDGEYTAELVLEGGSGRASVESPAVIQVENGEAFARIVWSSPNYDYMKLGEELFYPINTEGNSTFCIPICFDTEMKVIADTTAMSQPHEIEYTLVFDSATLK